MKILELKQNIFKENEVTADKIRDELKKQKKLINLLIIMIKLLNLKISIM